MGGEPVQGNDKLDCGFNNLLRDFEKAQLTIIGEQVLHPMFEFILANSHKTTSELLEEMIYYINDSIEKFKTSEHLQILTQTQDDKHVIFMSFEGNYREFYNKAGDLIWGHNQHLAIAAVYNQGMKALTSK